MKRILVLNPNSSADATDQMRRGCAGLRLPADQALEFATLPGGPAGIETQRHVESVVIPTADYCLKHSPDACVIACFSDPALALLREETTRPVVGIAESAYLMASGLGDCFGIVSIRTGSIGRHKRSVQALGLEDRLAGDRALELGVADLLSAPTAVKRIIEVGTRLRDDDGAQVLILGCATMGIYRSRVEEVLGICVVDPVQAGVLRASGLLAVNYRRHVA